ncbi:MAG: VWA domain-containing protein [Anaerolineae bacterium]
MAHRVRSVRRHSALAVIVPILIACSLVTCIGIYALRRCGTPGGIAQDQPTLRLAFSTDKEPLLKEILRRFQASQPKLADGRTVSVQAEALSSDKMIELALNGDFQAISPDSALWLAELDRRWAEQNGVDSLLVSDRTRYMVSPIVIAMWRDVATSLGYPDKELGWADLLRAATTQPQFKWSHPSAGTASGLLSTLAIFYAGAGMTRGLTEEAATAPATLAYVTQLERTVRHYGEAEEAVIAQVEAQGRDYLDAFVVQEQLVLRYNLANPQSLVAIYPVEGSMWADHPLALLELPNLTDDQRLAYDLFKRFLLSPAIQQYIFSQGYRPADLSIRLDGVDSILSAKNGLDSAKPYTTLQIPSPDVIEVVKNAWAYTKRPANIYLVADVSGSMEGDKLVKAQAALLAFVQQIPNETERVGLIVFSSSAREVVPLAPIADSRDRLGQTINGLTANGNTALFDGVAMALRKLRSLNDSERINAIVVMTDGKENNSSVRLDALLRDLKAATTSDAPVLVFCIAYGGDADLKPLESMSKATGAFAKSSDLTTISELYKTLSTYF